MAICVTLYEGIRRFNLTRVLFGMKAAGKAREVAPPRSPIAARWLRWPMTKPDARLTACNRYLRDS
jgi:hypothetical protein